MPSPRKGRPARARKDRKKPRQAQSLTLSDLEQIRVLADPLRIRILEEICTAERTTKQVAERIGEKPTKLYHHVEALERVGLIRQSRTRRVRGTLEKYYIAVARQFRADSRLFSAADSGSEPEGEALREMISSIFDRTSNELRSLVSRGHGKEGIEDQGVLSHIEIRTDRKHARRIQARLMRLLKSLEETSGDEADPGSKGYRLTIAFYPIDLED